MADISTTQTIDINSAADLATDGYNIATGVTLTLNVTADVDYSSVSTFGINGPGNLIKTGSGNLSYSSSTPVETELSGSTESFTFDAVAFNQVGSTLGTASIFTQGSKQIIAFTIFDDTSESVPFSGVGAGDSIEINGTSVEVIENLGFSAGSGSFAGAYFAEIATGSITNQSAGTIALVFEPRLAHNDITNLDINGGTFTTDLIFGIDGLTNSTSGTLLNLDKETVDITVETFAGNLNLNTLEAEINGDSFTSEISGIVSGTGNLIKAGGNVLTLSGTNTYSGTTTVNNGNLHISSDANLGVVPSSSQIDIIINGGVLGTTANITLNNNRSISGDSVRISQDASTTLIFGGTISSDSNTISKRGEGTFEYTGNSIDPQIQLEVGTLHLNNATVNNIRQVEGFADTPVNLEITGDCNTASINDWTDGIAITLNDNSNLTASGITVSVTTSSISTGTNTNITINNTSTAIIGVPISGSTNIIKNNGGQLRLSGENVYTGTTTINGGIIDLRGSINSDSITTINNGGTLLVQTTQTINSLNGLDGSQLTVATGNILTFGNGNDNILPIVLNGGGSIVKQGTGVTTVSSTLIPFVPSHLHLGSLVINESIVNFNRNALNSTAQGTLFNNQSTTDLIINNSSEFKTLSGIRCRNLSGSGSLVLGEQVGSVLTSANLIIDSTENTTFSGVISGPSRLTKRGFLGLGTLTLSGMNTYSGGTIISAGGKLSISDDNNLGEVPSSVDADNIIFDSSNGALLITSDMILNSNRGIQLNEGILNLETDNNFSYDGNITGTTTNVSSTYDSITYFGQTGMIKHGSGIFTFNGEFTPSVNGLGVFTNPGIVIGDGTLLVSNTSTINGDISTDVISFDSSKNPTLMGSGTINGNVRAYDGLPNFKLIVGSSIGTMNINGDLTLNSGSITEIEFNQNTLDMINVTGTINLNGALHLYPEVDVYHTPFERAFIQGHNDVSTPMNGTFTSSQIFNTDRIGHFVTDIEYNEPNRRVILLFEGTALTPTAGDVVQLTTGQGKGNLPDGWTILDERSSTGTNYFWTELNYVNDTRSSFIIEAHPENTNTIVFEWGTQTVNMGPGSAFLLVNIDGATTQDGDLNTYRIISGADRDNRFRDCRVHFVQS